MYSNIIPKSLTTGTVPKRTTQHLNCGEFSNREGKHLIYALYNYGINWITPCKISETSLFGTKHFLGNNHAYKGWTNPCGQRCRNNRMTLTSLWLSRTLPANVVTPPASEHVSRSQDLCIGLKKCEDYIKQMFLIIIFCLFNLYKTKVLNWQLKLISVRSILAIPTCSCKLSKLLISRIDVNVNLLVHAFWVSPFTSIIWYISIIKCSLHLCQGNYNYSVLPNTLNS